jgi:hypothetical protein
LNGLELPMLFRSRIYQGQFGSAQFQSVYQPYHTWWFQIFTTVEWMGLGGAALMSAGLAWLLSPWAAAGLTLLAALMWAATFGSAWTAAGNAARAKKWRESERAKVVPLVAFLHLAQPFARAWGRLKGWWLLRQERIVHPAANQLYGNLTQRDTWLRRLEEQLRNCGWISKSNSDWDDYDLEVKGPGPVRLRLISVYEEDLERAQHYVRYRVETHWKLSYLPKGILLAGLFGLCLSKVYLLPLAFVFAFGLFRLAHARRIQSAALSQLAMECAEPLGMVPVKNF